MNDIWLENSIKRQLSWLGKVTEVHVFGKYQIAEYRETEDDSKVHYHPYVDGCDTSHSFGTLEEAAAFAIAYKAEGPNTKAAGYFVKMLGIE
jgi:hypothetical protein